MGDLRAAAAFRIGQQLVDVLEDGFGTQPIHQLAHAQHAGAIGGYLGAEVAGGLAFGAHLGHDQLEDVWNDFSALDQLDAGNLDALLVDFLECTDGRRCTTANVDMVGEVDHVAKQLAAVVNGRDQGNVIQVGATSVRIVAQQSVTWAKVFHPILAHHIGHQSGQRAEVRRLVE